jgi:hypothetical protein
MFNRILLGVLSLIAVFAISWTAPTPLKLQFIDTDDEISNIAVNPTEVWVINGQPAKFYASCRNTKKWQFSKDGGKTWKRVLITYPYRIRKDTLFIDETSIDMDGYLYRIKCCKDDDDDDDDCDDKSSDCVVSLYSTLHIDLPMPLHWINFKCSSTSKSNKLQWYTEDKFNHIYVERLDDKGVWNIIGESKTGNINSYYFEDSNPIKGHNYYRLKGIFDNGNYEYSKIAGVYYSESEEFYKYYDIYGRESFGILEPYKMYFRVSGNKRERIVIH